MRACLTTRAGAAHDLHHDRKLWLILHVMRPGEANVACLLHV